MAFVRATRKKSEYRRAFRPYGLAIGDVVYSWNALHDELAAIFELTINSKNKSVGVNVWYSTDSDYAQRKMLKAALDKATHFTAKQRADISWMLNKIEESLRFDRNDVIHSPLIFLLGGGEKRDTIQVIANFASNSPRAKSLWNKSNINLLRHLRELAKTAESFADYARQMFKALLAPATHAWPEKPKLPHAHRTSRRKESSRQNIAK